MIRLIGKLLTLLIPGKFRKVPNIGTRLKKLIATGKKPLKRVKIHRYTQTNKQMETSANFYKEIFAHFISTHLKLGNIQHKQMKESYIH